MIQLILGGARSGKSRLAEKSAQQFGKTVIYVATAQAGDAEMKTRIQHHQQQRPQSWQLCEEPLYLAQQLKMLDHSDHVILVDCLTLWMSNLLMQTAENFAEQQIAALLEVLPHLQADIILVSNETGLGVVPLGEITRKFVDESGRLHQQLGQIANKVQFCVAGFPMLLKGENS
ncbi:MAG: bifunctional adenosylcobinamide kinase/adenosylcobinamide-phosphate guanylyltransferase [Gammaproteobacteria bacterium]|jgi:adenosylcobinamide kinase/adenosylcobinamide-phosphate guanylyltransferase|uniref:bifunctional adenosylcobinamide kinase/adenosylcobinamide-phosphate guanylyltransferase n=1 Tax=Acinetobacter towneri TaxID=202956 RepID=UPI0016AEB644|nr:bifunctional adenosylcobinamide kinase/adenosylcobinamide-phosphate guanylyltransferase [Acinetobacter towneri]MDM1487653.1 bifunctional adenosylcobinamide kinase/adenosylcobinamide-phosphate guanylyltransferase [Acinetobacter towneri]NLN58174.1 bifunctional adenosylcobinamide kinase/adenosylcobinamide-phosphate guanylyltransferase [Gammaproteobacteria bacterium]